MVFPWHVPAQNDSVRAANPTWRDEMHKREVKDRAALLFRLGRSKNEVTAALKHYIQWEFDGLATPKILGQLDALVDEVHKRQKPAQR